MQTSQPALPGAADPDAFSGAVDVVGELFRAPDGGFAVLAVVTEAGDEAIVVGGVAHLHPGDRAQLSGRWDEHPSFGRQVRASEALPLDPAGEEDRVALLTRLPGVGPKRARLLVQRHGDGLFSALDGDAGAVLGEVPGLRATAAGRAAAAWEQSRGERDLHLLLAGCGLGRFAAELTSRHGPSAAAALRADPYLLVRVPGIGFASADRLALSLGLDPASPRRAAAAILHTLQSAGGGGHAFLPLERLLRRARELVETVADEHLAALASEGAAVLEGERAYTAASHRDETTIARRLVELDATPDPLDLGLDVEPGELSTDQFNAVRACFAAGVSVFVGGPGTGKTHTTRVIAELCDRHDISLALCAPTGRAAERLRQSTGETAQTIHRLLGIDRTGEAAFGPDLPLPADLVLVDEVSMVDQSLMAKLVAALRPGARLCLVGDADQLPSVQAGQVLADVIDSGQFLTTRLTYVFRQAERSAIVRAAHRINAGALPRSAAETEAERDFFVMPERDPVALAELVRDLVARRLPAHLGVDPREIQVLAPMRRGASGVGRLNELLQAELNPEGEPVAPLRRRDGGGSGALALRIGDRAIQTGHNDYELDLMNGTLLWIGGDDPGSARVTAVDEAGRALVIPHARLDHVEPAYAMTVHKAQGCEWPVVVVAVHGAGAHPALLSRRLLYTAVTRARRMLVLCGDPHAIERAIGNVGAESRCTGLAARIARAARAIA